MMTMSTEGDSHRSSRLPVVFFAIAALALMAGGWLFYRGKQQALQLEIEERLQAIVRLKTDQLQAWRHDQWVDAGLIATNPMLAEQLALGLAAEVQEGTSIALQAYLRQVRDEHDYAEILVADAEGRVRVSVNGQVSLDAVYAEAVATAMSERRRIMVDMLVLESGAPIPPGVVAPLFGTAAAEDAAPLGALILINDPADFVFPVTLEPWTASKTGETLLVRRGGAAIYIFGEAQYQDGAGRAIRVSSDDNGRAEVMALTLDTPVVTGLDSRGHEVLAAVLRIPDSSWHLVSKIDVHEAFAAWRIRARLVMSMLAAGLIALIACGCIYLQRHRRLHYEALYHAEARRRAEAERYRVILRSIGDAVIAVGVDARVQVMNEAAERMTGWAESEAIGEPLDSVFRVVNGLTGEPVESPASRVLREGGVVGLANHTVLVARDGMERPIADSGAPVCDEQGKVSGVVLVFQDQSEPYAYQRQLEASETRYRTLIEGAPEAIFIQAGGCFAYLNPACRELLGAPSSDSLLGQPVLDRFAPDCQQQVRERIRRLNEQRQSVERIEETMLSLSGEPIAVAVSAVPYEQNGTSGAMVYVRDIRPRKTVEDALKRTVKMLARTESIAHLGSWELDVIHDAVTWSDEMYHIFGLSPVAPAPSLSEHDSLYAHEDFARLMDAIDACVKTGAPYELELRGKRVDGTTFYCLAKGQAERGADGRIIRLGGSLQDIDDQKRVEQAHKRLVAAVEQAVEGIMITDPDGVIQYVNPAFERISGYSSDEAIGKTPNLHKSGEHDEAFYAEMWTVISQGRIWQGEIVNRRKDGTLYTDETIISSVLDEAGAIVNFVAVMHDVSERKRMEAERESLQKQMFEAQKMESVGRLAGGVAHDFNNMLNVILGNAQLAMLKVNGVSPVTRHLQQIVDASERSAQITRQLLTFARRVNIVPCPLNLNDRVDQMLGMVKQLIGEDIKLSWQPQDGLWSVYLDPGQVDQMLINLCVNARDAIGDVGTIIIETKNVTFDEAYCAHHPGFRPGDFVLLAVSDDGCGMDTASREKIFEPFYTTKGVGEGTGLGLAIIHGIVNQNNGFINVYSEPDHGTTFKIYLARHHTEADASRRPDRPVIPEGQGETILLVEDETLILRLGEEILSDLGYNVLATASPADALEIARQRQGDIHLLVTDVIMPDMNGRDLATRVHAIYPDMRILFMSGYTADVISQRGVRDAGMNFLQKPFSRAELAQEVRNALDKR